jgi:endonuclease-3
MKANHRARCARVNRALIKHWGEPKWSGPQEPLDVLIRTVLSQSTTARNSSRAYKALRDAYGTWDEVAEARPESVAKVLRSGGLAKQ